MRKSENELFQYELKLLEESVNMLEFSYSNCIKIDMEEIYVMQDLDKLEALTARFARTSDIIVQKMFRLIDRIELEFEGSAIDRINRAEKRGIINSAEEFKEIRRLRNEISHEYVPDNIKNIFLEVLEKTPLLLQCVKAIRKYGEKHNWL